jgi:hypothetical protein
MPITSHPRRDPAPRLRAWGVFVALLAAVASAGPAAAQRPLEPERQWSDASGMFTVTASLVGIDGDFVTLRQGDGSEVRIEIGQLSRRDRLVAQRARRRLTLRVAGGPPATETFATSARATNHRNFPPPAVALEPDPIDAAIVAVDGLASIPREDHFDRVGRVIPVGAGMVLVAVENTTPGRPLPTRLVWLSLEKQAILSARSLPSADLVLDYHPVLERLLTMSREKFTAEGAANQKLTLWDVSPTRKEATAWLTWKAPCGDGKPLARHPWGRIVDDTRVLHQSSREEYSCWDIDGKQAVYRLEQYPGYSPLPALSGSRRYIALPDARRVQVCDTASGNVLASLPIGDCSGVAFDPAGRRLAVVQEGNVQIHDLADPTGPIVLFRAQGANPHHTAVAWVGEEHLLVQASGGPAAVLYGVEPEGGRLGLPVWRYQWQAVPSGDMVDDLATRVVQGRLLYAAPTEQEEEEVEKKSDGTLAVIVAAVIPEPPVIRAIEKLPEALPALVEPGTAVATKVAAGPRRDGEITAMRKLFERTKWIEDAASPAVIEAGQTGGGIVTYKDAEGRERQLKQVSPTTLRLRLVVHGVSVLEAKLSTDVPDTIALPPGESDSDLAARLPAPATEWFDRLILPARIVDVTEANGLGATRCGPTGLEPKGAK